MSAADLLIIGAGPAGASTAIHAARAGLHVTVVDRARFPRDKPCSEYMSPEAVRHLDRLGVLAALDGAGGTPLAGTTVIGPRGSRLTGLFARAGTAPWRPTGLSLPRYLVDNHLVAAARAAGATVLEGHAVEDLLFTRGTVAGAMVRRPDGSHLPLRARLTIGADASSCEEAPPGPARAGGEKGRRWERARVSAQGVGRRPSPSARHLRRCSW